MRLAKYMKKTCAEVPALLKPIKSKLFIAILIGFSYFYRKPIF